MQPAQSRFAHLDSLRGFAALAVIYFHTGYDAITFNRLHFDWERGVFDILTQRIDLGKVAVTLFFMISGFVIPFSLKRDGEKPVEGFIIGRFFRLYPAYWLSIGAAFIVNYHMTGTDLGLFTLLANITMLQGFVGQPSTQGLYWTLQIELIFYGLCVLLFLFSDLRRPVTSAAMAALMLGAALAAAVLRYMSGKVIPVAIPLAMFVMFIGLLWRLATVDGDHQARRAVMLLLPTFVVAMPVIAAFAYGDDAPRYTLTYFLAVGILLLCTTKAKVKGPFFSFLGRISYSVYLFGSLVQKLFEKFLGEWWQAMGIPLHLAILGMMAVTIAIAAFVYRFIEVPAIAWGRSIIRHRLRTAPKDADSVAL